MLAILPVQSRHIPAEPMKHQSIKLGFVETTGHTPPPYQTDLVSWRDAMDSPDRYPERSRRPQTTNQSGSAYYDPHPIWSSPESNELVVFIAVGLFDSINNCNTQVTAYFTPTINHFYPAP